MSNKHQIKTVQDMIDCTNEDNLDAFLVDLKNLIETVHNFQGLTESLAESQGLPREIAAIETDGFTWIDDGEHKAHVTIKTK